MKNKIVGIFVCMLVIAGIGNVMSVKSQTRSNDVGVMSIDSPNGCYNTITLPVKVTIKNYGDTPEKNFFTEVKIGNVTSGIQYDQEIAVVTSINPDQTMTLTFSDITFITPVGCKYYVNASTQLNGDTNPANDYLNITIYIDLIKPMKYGFNFLFFHLVFAKDNCSGVKTIQWWRTPPGGTPAPWGAPIVVTTVPGQNTWFYNLKFGVCFGKVNATVFDWAGNWK